MAETTAIVDIVGLRKSFGSSEGKALQVLDQFDLRVFSGEFLVILGPSGCGKSTLLNLICHQDQPDAGTIRFAEGINLNGRRDVTVVWQEDALMPWKTAAANVEFPLLAKGVAEKERAAIVAHWLKLTGLEGFEGYYPSQLSQGMQKRVAIAAALAAQPRLVLMDEPFAALDVNLKLQIQNELVSLWEKLKFTVVMVTHDVQEAAALADRIVLLTNRPARVKLIRVNHLPRPRHLNVLYGDATFHELVRELWNLLAKSE